jgi:hypothetical protein
MVPGDKLIGPWRGSAGSLGGNCIGCLNIAVVRCYCTAMGYYLVWPGDRPVRVALLPELVDSVVFYLCSIWIHRRIGNARGNLSGFEGTDSNIMVQVRMAAPANR